MTSEACRGLRIRSQLSHPRRSEPSGKEIPAALTLTTCRERARLGALHCANALDFFGLSDDGKARFILLALSQGQSFALTSRNPEGGRDSITCDLTPCLPLRRLFDETILPAWRSDPAPYLSVRAEGIEPSGACPNLLFFADGNGKVSCPGESGEWGCIHISEQQLLPAFCHQLLGMTAGEGILMGELCFGLEEGTAWGVFRDGEAGICGAPITGRGCFQAVVDDLQQTSEAVGRQPPGPEEG